MSTLNKKPRRLDSLCQSELAEELGVSKVTICNWTAGKVITPRIKEGRLYRYDLKDVKRQLQVRAGSGLEE